MARYGAGSRESCRSRPESYEPATDAIATETAEVAKKHAKLTALAFSSWESGSCSVIELSVLVISGRARPVDLA